MEAIYTYNRLEKLCQQLADNIRYSNEDVFSKEVIITQTNGMNAWLKTELAQRNSVLANFEFQNQDGFLSEIYKLLFKERFQNNVDSIKYKIFDCLNNPEFEETFPEIAMYYKGSELRRFQLASRIADLFDQYQLYRPETIENWNNDKLSTQNADETWQKWLWRKLETKSRTEIKLLILKELKNQKDLFKKMYPVISLFGISVYTQFHLDFFKELAKHTQVNFYLCLPTNQPKGENELLESFGSKAAELAMMFEYPAFNPEQNDADTLLSRIQNQIHKNESGLEWIEDESIQINSCYTPVRESECLYNYLLDLFEKDETLRPRDVLVMTTDIDKYAPFIKAVFRNAPINIPFQVSGAANNSDDSMIAALEQILNLTEDEMTSEKVISLLEQKRIKQRFGIQDTKYIRSVVRKANIRFGSENRTEDDTQYVSWKYGLEKILLGYAMLTDEEYLIDEKLTLYPFKDAEASVSHDLFCLKAFVKILESLLDEQNKLKTLKEWKIFLFENVIEKMIYCDDFNKDDRGELSAIYKALSFLDQQEIEKEVSFSVFLDELKTKLFRESRESKLNTGRVTISSPIPLRGLPFKVICFLGLNNDVFPRKDRFMGFDLLGAEYQIGDRNKKETDKYLFLDTILAAREKLYLSYIGQSIKDNTEIPPSIVLDTLLDYMGKEKFVVKHPLHGFSSKYQKDDPRMFTYLYSEQGVKFEPKVQKSEELTEVLVYSFIKYFEHPIEWYFKNILGIKYEETDDTLPEYELFELDHLQKWQIKNDILSLDEEGVNSYLQMSIKEGLMPLKNLGRVTLDELIEETTDIRTTYKSLIQGIEELNVAVDIIIDDIQIRGTINGVFDRQYIACSFSKSSEKNMVRAYLRTLLLCAMNEIEKSILIDSKGGITELPTFSSKEAKYKIKELLDYYKKGMNTPLKFTIDAYKQVKSKTKVENVFKKEAIGDFYASLSPNRYQATLFEEGYFEEFTIENFNSEHFEDSIYDDLKYDEIKAIACLLNL